MRVLACPVIVVAVAVVPPFAASSAVAATAVAVRSAGAARIDDFTVWPSHADADHRVHFSGRLVTVDDDGTPRSLPDEFIDVQERAGTTLVGYADAITDSSGRFAGDLTVDQDGTVLAQSAAGVKSAAVPVTVTTARTRLSGTLSPAQPAGGDIAQITGRLERQTTGGDWVPMGDRPISFFRPDGQPAQVPWRTKADGSFIATFRAGAATSWKLGFVPGALAFAPAQVTVSVRDPAHLLYRSGFNNFGLNAHWNGRGYDVLPGDTFHLGADLWGWNPGSQQTLTGRRAWLEFSADGTTWARTRFSRATDREGMADIAVQTRAAGHWRMSFDGDARYTPARTSSIFVGIRKPTASRFIAFKATPTSVRKGRTLTITGTVQGLGRIGKGRAIGPVTVYFRPRGSRSWRKVKTVVLRGSGSFKVSAKAARSGTWKAHFAGDGNDLPVTSRYVYITVR
ncbi:hypothetical protein J4573_08815 [Actinomadura barringtoniae]|uniref:Htaa domain-containing protein n=1 Tax=Actinomadura barringtoniae TaxID=1427535 RepID=A0A939PBU0_9ACTN|nr:hypothetical protein [Actinomadura barringtoniae]MBO2447183.1 hypothetical protein [Actinomadura barringtoniae]